MLESVPPKSMKMRGVIKEFDEDLYNKYDIPARNLVKEKLGVYVRDNPDIYAQDLILDIPAELNCKYKYIELQVCASWIGESYPYSCPFIYERKAGYSFNTLFIIFNRNFTRGLLFDRAAVNNVPRRARKYSKYYVYDINWGNVVQFYTEHFNIDQILYYDY